MQPGAPNSLLLELEVAGCVQWACVPRLTQRAFRHADVWLHMYNRAR